MQEPLLGRWLWVGGGEREMERGVGRERTGGKSEGQIDGWRD